MNIVKTSIGQLKLSPIKENGKFVFLNDFITINGKVSKGDYVKIFVDAYQPGNGKFGITGTPSALLNVKGKEYQHTAAAAYATVEDYYNDITQVYKDHFYFGKKEA
jgi:hypothetical protein